MKTVRISAGAGYAGDRIEPALENIRRGNIDYIMFECLAERTIALAQKDRAADPQKGYNRLLEYRMERVLPLLREHPVKIITNMGAANPVAAVEKVRKMAAQYDLTDLKIAAVIGDEVTERIPAYGDLTIMETGEPLHTLADKIVSANAYIGGRQISQALADGADIVITGRVADPALAVGPLMYEFGKDYDANVDFLGKATVAGHLLECGAQVTGGYFADPGVKDVPELWNLGFPILTFTEDERILLEKLPQTGGRLDRQTVTEQLLYEIQDPANYFTPDVIADFSRLSVEELSDGRVEVKGAAGKKRTGTLKVSVGYQDGYIGEGQISYGGRNCVARAKLAAEVIQKRLVLLNKHYSETRTDLIGVNSLYGAEQEKVFPALQLSEVRLRVAVRAGKKRTRRSLAGRSRRCMSMARPEAAAPAAAWSRCSPSPQCLSRRKTFTPRSAGKGVSEYACIRHRALPHGRQGQHLHYFRLCLPPGGLCHSGRETDGGEGHGAVRSAGRDPCGPV